MTSCSTMQAAMAAIIAAGSIGVAATVGPSAATAAEQQAGADDASEYARLSGGKLSLVDAIAPPRSSSVERRSMQRSTTNRLTQPLKSS